MVLCKTIRQFLIRLHLSYDSAIMVMHIYPKNNKANVCKNMCRINSWNWNCWVLDCFIVLLDIAKLPSTWSCIRRWDSFPSTWQQQLLNFIVFANLRGRKWPLNMASIYGCVSFHMFRIHLWIFFCDELSLIWKILQVCSSDIFFKFISELEQEKCKMSPEHLVSAKS